MSCSQVELITCQLAALILVIIAAIVDWCTYRLPHILTLPAAAMALIGVGIFGSGWFYAISGAAVGFLFMKVAQILCRYRYKRECIGSGDCFLMLSIGALTGFEAIPWVIFGAVSLFAIVCLVRKVNKLPFGPFLVISCLSCVLLQM